MTDPDPRTSPEWFADVQPFPHVRQPRCKCSHARSVHGTDRRDRPTCFGSFVCGCQIYRPKESE